MGAGDTVTAALLVFMVAEALVVPKDVETRVSSLAGADIPVARQKDILLALGYGVTETADALTCSVPSWRPDVHGEADLVEEVCRIWGLDNIPAQPMARSSAIARPVLNPLQKPDFLRSAPSSTARPAAGMARPQKRKRPTSACPHPPPVRLCGSSKTKAALSRFCFFWNVAEGIVGADWGDVGRLRF